MENRPQRGWRRIDLAELWRYRELVLFLARRDLSVRYKQAVFGVLWAVLQPLVGALAFTLVFRGVAKVPSDGIPYPLFAFVGFVAWTYLSHAVTAGTESLVVNVSLVTKVYFPRIAAPVSAVLPALVDVGVGLVVLAAFLAWYGVVPGAAVVATPVLLLLLVGLALGISLWLSTFHVQYRDARHATPLVLQVWLFASPIAYPASAVDGVWGALYRLNPMVGIVGGLRWALAGGPFPGLALLTSAVVVVGLIVTGAFVFARSERRFADVI